MTLQQGIPALAALLLSLPAWSLSLADALAEAERASPVVFSATAGVTRAKAGETSASVLLPSDLTVESAYTSAAPSGGSDRDLSFGLRQKFEIAGQRGLRLDSARAGVRAAERRGEGVQRVLRADVTEAYAAAWAAGSRVELAVGLEKTARELVAVSRRRVEAGDLAALSGSTVEIDAGRAAVRVATAKATERRLRAELGRLMGRATRLDDALELPVPADKGPGPEEELIRQALAAQRELAALRDELDGAKAEQTLASRTWVPSPTLELGYAATRETVRGDPVGGVVDDSLLTVGLSLPLSLYGRNKAATAQADARVVELEALVAREQLATTAEVRERLAAITEAQASLAALEGIARQLESNLELSRRGFEAGELDLSDYLVARSTAFEAKGELIDARGALVTAWASLQALTGET